MWSSPNFYICKTFPCSLKGASGLKQAIFKWQSVSFWRRIILNIYVLKFLNISDRTKTFVLFFFSDPLMNAWNCSSCQKWLRWKLENPFVPCMMTEILMCLENRTIGHGSMFTDSYFVSVILLQCKNYRLFRKRLAATAAPLFVGCFIVHLSLHNSCSVFWGDTKM